jgi:hypothetical protein
MTGENKELGDHCSILVNMLPWSNQGKELHREKGKVEQKCHGRIRAMLNGAGLKNEVRNGIWLECASTATFHSYVLHTNGRSKSPHELMFGNQSH